MRHSMLATKDAESAAIEARGLTKHFGSVRAVDGIDLDVPRGMIFGIHGPKRRRQDHIAAVLTRRKGPRCSSPERPGADSPCPGLDCC